jgi:hypothetical protein
MRLPHLLGLVLSVALAAPTVNAQSAALRTDFERLVGPGWSGTLTYRDYTTEARTTIKAALLLTKLPDDTDASARWDFRIAYADEPHANSGDTISLSADGRRFRRAMVVERTVLPSGEVQVVTEENGQDNDRPARLRLVYRISERKASLQKMVRYEGGEFFERHIYEWTR